MMAHNFFKRLKPLVKSLVVIGLVLTLAFGQADGALAARAGGRMGGGSFRAPSRPYAPPARTYRGPSGGGYYPGGGFGFPFIMPIFGIGGGFGGLFSILIFFAIANFLVRSFRGVSEETEVETGYETNPTVSVARLQVGLLAEARSLQEDLNRIAATADTGSSAGLAQLLQETTLSLLRHPDYWAYASTDDKQTRLLSAEQEFNRLALTERSKFTAESLSNVNNQLKQAEPKAALPGAGALAQQPGEYIVATIVVGVQGKLDLPTISSEQDLRRALSQIGAVSSEKLLAVEVLWTPQQSGETLTSDELIAEYPDLKLV